MRRTAFPPSHFPRPPSRSHPRPRRASPTNFTPLFILLTLHRILIPSSFSPSNWISTSSFTLHRSSFTVADPLNFIILFHSCRSNFTNPFSPFAHTGNTLEFFFFFAFFVLSVLISLRFHRNYLWSVLFLCYEFIEGYDFHRIYNWFY